MSTYTITTEVEVEATNPIEAVKQARAMLADVNVERLYDVFPTSGESFELPGHPVQFVAHLQVTLWGDEAKIAVVSS